MKTKNRMKWMVVVAALAVALLSSCGDNADERLAAEIQAQAERAVRLANEESDAKFEREHNLINFRLALSNLELQTKLIALSKFSIIQKSLWLDYESRAGRSIILTQEIDDLKAELRELESDKESALNSVKESAVEPRSIKRAMDEMNNFEKLDAKLRSQYSAVKSNYHAGRASEAEVAAVDSKIKEAREIKLFEWVQDLN